MLAIKAEVPAQAMVDEAFRSRAMLGRSTPMPFWSMKQTQREKAMQKKTLRSCRSGRRFVWSWRAASRSAVSLAILVVDWLALRQGIEVVGDEFEF